MKTPAIGLEGNAEDTRETSKGDKGVRISVPDNRTPPHTHTSLVRCHMGSKAAKPTAGVLTEFSCQYPLWAAHLPVTPALGYDTPGLCRHLHPRVHTDTLIYIIKNMEREWKDDAKMVLTCEILKTSIKR